MRVQPTYCCRSSIELPIHLPGFPGGFQFQSNQKFVNLFSFKKESHVNNLVEIIVTIAKNATKFKTGINPKITKTKHMNFGNLGSTHFLQKIVAPNVRSNPIKNAIISFQINKWH